MNRLLELAASARLFLEENLGVGVAWAVVPLSAFLVVYCIRRFTPRLWLAIESWGPQASPASKLFQALPSILVGAAVSAIGTDMDPWKAMLGAGLALLAPLAHHLVKASPLPYRGAVSALVSRWFPPGGAAMLVVLALGGCSPSATKYATHTAANTVAAALQLVDASLEAEIDAATAAKLSEMSASGATAEDFSSWLAASGLLERTAALSCAFAAHEALVSALETGEAPGIPLGCLLDVLQAEAAKEGAPAVVRKAADVAERLVR